MDVSNVEVVELRLAEDSSCTLEVDVWELLWYIDTTENVHFDVWLKTDGVANICENVNSGVNAMVGECGDKEDATCWEWDICPSESYFSFYDDDEDDDADDAYLDWFFGSSFDGMGIGSYW